MDLRGIIEKQKQFDRDHGWDTAALTDEGRLQALERELVGLMGEVGEVANLIKKARLVAGRAKPPSNAFMDVVPAVKEELIDVFIYLLRMFQITHADVEAEYLRKLASNRDRFREFGDGTA